VYTFFNEYDSQLRSIGDMYIHMAGAYDKPGWIAVGEGFIADGDAGLHESSLLGLIVPGMPAPLYFMWSVRQPK
jgi:hypothetical protein